MKEAKLKHNLYIFPGLYNVIFKAVFMRVKFKSFLKPSNKNVQNRIT